MRQWAYLPLGEILGTLEQVFLRGPKVVHVEFLAISAGTEVRFSRAGDLCVELMNRISIPVKYCRSETPYNNPTAYRQAENALEKQIKQIGNSHSALLQSVEKMIGKTRAGFQ